MATRRTQRKEPVRRAGTGARGPGRPRRGPALSDDVKRELVAAARDLFARRGFSEVGIRELSRAAGVTPGMISYYFGGKQGLYEAMLASVFDDLLARVRELAAQPAESTAPLAALIRLYTATITSQPWLPALVLREVIFGDEETRARFVERFAQRAAVILPGLIRAEIESGALRRDLDPALMVLALVGTSLFPFLAHPVMGKVLGYELDDDFAQRLATHTTRLLLDGARPRADGVVTCDRG
jgi:TetR/AcrR family transcriptional regulator